MNFAPTRPFLDVTTVTRPFGRTESRKGSLRIPGIDVLRGISILAVIMLHVNIRVPLNVSPLGQNMPKQLIHSLVWNGAPGVIIFFAVSGFLITSTCLRRWHDLRNISVREFYRMRFARIAPCLLALLAVCSILHLAGLRDYTIDPHQVSLPRAIFAALTFHINWLEAKFGYLPATWDVLWSLSVEESFYFFFPLLCRWVRREFLLLLMLAFVIIGPFARTVLTHNELWADHGYLSCMDAIAIGCCAALLARGLSFGAKTRTAMGTIGVAMLAFIMIFNRVAFRFHVYQCGVDVTILALGASMLAVTFSQGHTAGTPWTAPLQWFGRHSYEVYLTHSFVVLSFVQIFHVFCMGPRTIPLLYVAVVCVSGLLGATVAKFFSEPLNRTLRRPM